MSDQNISAAPKPSPPKVRCANRIILFACLLLLVVGSIGCSLIPSAGGTNTESIRVKKPLPEETVTSPLTVTGIARGTWYFEGQFPVRLIDQTGSTLARGNVSAQSNWMTEKFVPFRSILRFEVPDTAEEGKLILKASNPSGKPNLKRTIEVPVKF